MTPAEQPHRQSEVAVRLRQVAKRYGAIEAVRPLDLAVPRGEFLAILGPSGCGKTTLLRMIGGFVRPSAGRIEVGGVDVTDLPPERRPTNMVFQGYGLFPHMNVRQNIAYGLTLRRLPAREVADRVARVLDLVRLGNLAERDVAELSGGQRQRVAVARALVLGPPVLLLDEPFSALDLKLRQAMQEELKRIHREIGGTFVFVTHDQGEALALASRIAVMNEGRLEQVGTPEDVYLAPATRFVAGFIGEANMLAGERRSGRVTTRAGLAFDNAGPDGPVVAVVRPEAVRLVQSDRCDFEVEGRLEEVSFLGSHVRYHIRLPSGDLIRAQEPSPMPLARAGDGVRVGWRAEALRVVADGDSA